MREAAPRVFKLRQVLLREPLVRRILGLEFAALRVRRALAVLRGLVAAACPFIKPLGLLIRRPFSCRNTTDSDVERVIRAEVGFADFVLTVGVAGNERDDF